MSKKIKKALISGYIGFGNFGDEAVFACLVSYLKSKGIEVSALSNTPSETAKTYSVKTYKYNKKSEIIKAIMSSDVLFSGGGSLLQNNTSNKSLIYYLSIIYFAKLLGKKVVIFAQGMEGIKGKFMQKITRNILSKCDIVTVRDKFSKKIMDGWNIESTLLCDPIYSVKLPPLTPKNQVGVQLRNYKYMNPLFIENLADNIGKHFHDKEIKIFAFQQEQDRNICLEFAMVLQKKFKDIDVEVILNPTINKIINGFSTLEYLIAMRYHACALGTMYGIKTMPIIYDDKVEELAKEAQIPYIRCEQDRIKDEIRDLINSNYKAQKKFDWSIFDKFLS